MGLIKGGINEVIATTAFNAAPIGIHYRDKTASMIIFSGSHTAKNLERDGWVVANLVHDPVLYVRTAFEDLPAMRLWKNQWQGGQCTGFLVPGPGLHLPQR